MSAPRKGCSPNGAAHLLQRLHAAVLPQLGAVAPELHRGQRLHAQLVAQRRRLLVADLRLGVCVWGGGQRECAGRLGCAGRSHPLLGLRSRRCAGQGCRAAQAGAPVPQGARAHLQRAEADVRALSRDALEAVLDALAGQHGRVLVELPLQLRLLLKACEGGRGGGWVSPRTGDDVPEVPDGPGPGCSCSCVHAHRSGRRCRTRSPAR
jgi:hypothetical protein